MAKKVAMLIQVKYCPLLEGFVENVNRPEGFELSSEDVN